MTAIALYHVNNVFRVTVNVMMNRSCFARRIKCIASEPVGYIVACQAVVTASKRAAGLVTLARVIRQKATRGAALKTSAQREDENRMLRCL